MAARPQKHAPLCTKRKIADRVPKKGEELVINVSDIIDDLSVFLSYNFEGLISIRPGKPSGGVLCICPDNIAYFYKSLLAEAHALGIIEMKISGTKDSLCFYLHLSDTTAFPDTEERQIVKSARMAGFDATRRDGGLLLTLRAVSDINVKIYDKPREQHALLSALYRIFFNR